MRDDYAEIQARFARDTAHHEMTVLHDDGLYRHLRFWRPDHGEYWFDLVTWPFNLVVKGDMGSFHFSRFGADTEEMFRLFRGRTHINPGYWAEKLCAGRSDADEYSEEKFREVVLEQVAHDRVLTALVETEILESDDVSYEDGARNLLNFFQHESFQFSDTWELNFHDWTVQYLWCCHAIVWGIQRYDAAKAKQAAIGAASAGVRELVADLISHSGFDESCWIVPSPTRWALLLPRADGPLYFTQSRMPRTVDQAVALGLVRLGELGPLPEHSGAPEWLMRRVPQPFEGYRITAVGGAL
jgi:hypothetical protein